MDEYAYVYILANGFKKLYIGITTSSKSAFGSTNRKNIRVVTQQSTTSTALVYFERFTTLTAAIARGETTQRLASYPQTRADYLDQSDVARSERGLGQANQALPVDCER